MNSTTKTVFSARWNLIKIEFKKIIVGFLIALAGAVITYLETNFIGDLRLALSDYLKPELIPLALGFMTAVNASLVNTIRKLVSKTTYIDNQAPLSGNLGR